MNKLALAEGYLLTFAFCQKQQPQQVWLAVDCWKKVFDMVI